MRDHEKRVPPGVRFSGTGHARAECVFGALSRRRFSLHWSFLDSGGCWEFCKKNGDTEMEKRVYNFAAGPAVLPLPAMEEAQRDLLALPGAGASILEISHRSKTFQAIIDGAEQNLRALLAIPDDYHVLFLQGGAQMQFAMVPMNLLRNSGKSADYILTGSWGKKAIKEAKTQGDVRVAWDGDAVELRRLPRPDELDLDPNAAYVHITSNETIQGVQFPAEPYFEIAPVGH